MAIGEQHLAGLGARATALQFVASCLNERPRAEMVARMRSIGSGAARAGVGDETVADRAVGQIEAYVASTESARPEEVERELAVDWTRLFRGVAPGYGPTPPLEAVWRDAKEPEVLLASLMATYRGHGVEISAERRERPDFLGVELEFLAGLLEDAAVASSEGNEECANRARRAAMSFWKDHVGRWAPSFCEAASKEARTPYYAGVLDLARATLSTMEQLEG